MANINRRNFMSAGAAMGMVGATGTLGMMAGQRAFAADVSGYKALVCIMFKGGIDHADVVFPYDQPSYNALRKDRGSLMGAYGGKRQRDALLKLSPKNAGEFGGREFALPPEMAALHQMFHDGEVAIVGGVGPLIEPTKRSQMKNGVILPDRLYSHNDQQSTWMSLDVEGAQQGWGGAFAEAAMDAAVNDPRQFATVTTASMDVFLATTHLRQYRLIAEGAPDLDLLQKRKIFGTSGGADDARRIFRQYLAGNGMRSDNLLMRDLIKNGELALDNAELIKTAMNQVGEISVSFPGKLGTQLSVVARGIAVQNALNISRQVYYVSVGGFDTHSNQSKRLPEDLANISSSLKAFRDALVELNMFDKVATCTMSEFGRTVIDNGDGTDHGWGGHHFVMGGAVDGGKIYGELAEQDTNSERYTDKRGRLIPGVSVEQYAATLGRWFGLDNGELARALPNLANFDQKDLGFLG